MAATVVVDTGASGGVETEDDERPGTEQATAAAAAGDDPADMPTDDNADDDDDDDDAPTSDLPFPLFASKAFYFLDQKTAPRRWCLQLVTSPYPFSHSTSQNLLFYLP